MVELRKRPRAPSDPPQPPQKKAGSVAKPTSKPEPTPQSEAILSTNGTGKSQELVAGDSIDLEGFGGVIETQAGRKTTLKKLVDDSKSGVVLFTYPKASTPGCKSDRTPSTSAHRPGRRSIAIMIRYHTSMSIPR